MNLGNETKGKIMTSKFSAFSTERLRLSDFTQADLKAFVSYRNDSEVARYQSWISYDMAQGEAFFAAQQALDLNQNGSWYQIAIADLASDQLLGDCAIHFVDDEADAPNAASGKGLVEIGFTLASENQGKGFAGEAITALLDFIFNTLNKRRVIAVTDVLNAGSIGLLESQGFRREAHLVENSLFKGGWGSEYFYGLLKREYSPKG
ncbi:MAG: RimJ/RimL family protein N-acetyltransferase [Alteromonadaceae bacterium]|jgi:RimJ/RimL family protein N-acetyltransferase